MLNPRKLVLEFTKMTGAGNDFIVLDNRFYHFSEAELAALARRWCDRRFGVGADGLLAYAAPQDPASHFRMQYHNADGSRGTMCANGARCLARYARWAGVEAARVRFETDAGVYEADVPEDHAEPVRLYLPAYRDFLPECALDGDAAREVGATHYIWTGTEHVVVFVGEVAAVPVAEWGAALRGDAALAPAGANINFVEVLPREAADEGTARLRVRTFEKGVEAETLACGTGATAAALTARLLGLVAADAVAVDMPGGRLRVGFREEAGTLTELYLEGPALPVFRGTLEV